MNDVGDLIATGRKVEHHRPWPRAEVSAEAWRQAIAALAEGRMTLLGLWAEPRAVHMALLGATGDDVGVISLTCPDARFPSVANHHAPADRLERTIRDLTGLVPEGARDDRPWLDHGRWHVARPLGVSAAKLSAAPYGYDFLSAEGESLHQIPVGPVHAGIIEPGHFRFTANGETVVRLEQRLGYVHKGVEALFAGAGAERGARLAGRLSGDSTVAYSLAFCRAVEAASQVQVPERAAWLRALMAELERLANHFGDIGAICNDASFAVMLAHCGILRESVLRAAAYAFGHRLMMDRIVPGGVMANVWPDALAHLQQMCRAARETFPELVALYDRTASLQDRTVGTGIVARELVDRFGAGGYVGRASGRTFDARRTVGYPPYDRLRFDVPIFSEGDVNARVWVRIREIEQSLGLIDQLITGLPGGDVRVALQAPGEPREGMAVVEGFRGDVLAWLRLGGDGALIRCHMRDPSWFQWPLLEAAIEGNIVADFPLCNKSFNCSYSGHDL
jgi:Ni,Fe-hydrogenase III large subunit